MEAELRVRYSTPHAQPLPDYCRLSSENPLTTANGVGRLESTDGRQSFTCEGLLSWNTSSIDGQFVSRDPRRPEILNLMNNEAPLLLRLTTNGSEILVEKANLTHFGFGAHASVRGGPVENLQVNFNVTALRLFREYTN